MARAALVRLRTPRPNVDTAIDELLNGLAGYDGRVVIVVDDLHHVRSERSLRSLVYAVERLPRPVRMVATTRSDPGRRLGRLRARGALGELRAKDLAFTVAETSELLERAGIPVGVDDVELLVDRTEGWPAGVSLAALWLARSRGARGRHPGVLGRQPSRRRLPDLRGPRRRSTRRRGTSCSGRRSSTASRRSSATPSWAPTTAPDSSPSSSARTSSSSRSTPAVPGTATTTSSASCCASSS